MDDLVCGKCGYSVEIDGDYPRVWAWCHECNDYAKGVDCEEIIRDQLIDQADMYRKSLKEG